MGSKVACRGDDRKLKGAGGGDQGAKNDLPPLLGNIFRLSQEEERWIQSLKEVEAHGFRSRSALPRTRSAGRKSSSKSPTKKPWNGLTDPTLRARPSTAAARFCTGTGVDSLGRAELEAVHDERKCVSEASLLLCHSDRRLAKGDFESGVNILKRVAKLYRKAGKHQEAADAEARLAKISVERTLNALSVARQALDFPEVERLAAQALGQYKKLTEVIVIDRLAVGTVADACYRDKEAYKEFLVPRECALRWALEDGQSEQKAARFALSKKRFQNASHHLARAQACFEWANAKAEKSANKRLQNNLDKLAQQHRGKYIHQKLVRRLRLFTPKDWVKMHAELEEVEKAFSHCKKGHNSVRELKEAMQWVAQAERLWLNLVTCLEQHKYSECITLLMHSRRVILASSAILSPSEKSVMGRLSELLGSKKISLRGIVCEIAAEDGLSSFAACQVALEREDLKQADSSASDARTYLEWVSATLVLHPSGANVDDACSNDGTADAMPLGSFVNASPDEISAALLAVERISSMIRCGRSGNSTSFSARIESIIEEIDSVQDSIQNRRGYLHASELMQAYKDARNRLRACPDADHDLVQSPLDLLSSAEKVYRSHGFEKEADKCERLRATTCALRLIESAREKSLSNESKAAAHTILKSASPFLDISGDEACRLRAGRLRHFLEGENARIQAEKLLECRDFDGALDLLEAAKVSYESAIPDPRAEDALRRIKSPFEVVRASSLSASANLREAALRALEGIDPTEARTLCVEARRCSEWAGDCVDPLTCYMSDLITMVEHLLAARDKVNCIKCASSKGSHEFDREGEKTLLMEARRLYGKGKGVYEDLVGRATSLMALTAAADIAGGLRLCSAVTKLFKPSDKRQAAEVDEAIDALAADSRLDAVGELMHHGLFVEVRSVISMVTALYEQFSCSERLAKIVILRQLTDAMESAHSCLQNRSYDAACDQLCGCRELLQTLAALPPASIIPPYCSLLDGNLSCRQAVSARAKEDGNFRASQAASLADEGRFSEARCAAEAAKESYRWLSLASGQTNECAGDDGVVNALLERIELEAAKAKGDDLLARGLQEQEQADYASALVHLEEARQHFEQARLQDLVIRVKGLIRRCSGDEHATRAAMLFEGGDLRACESELGIALSYFDADADESRYAETASFRSRVSGDMLMASVEPALRERQYDLGLSLMNQASDCYAQTSGRWTKRLGDKSTIKKQVEKRAIKDGEDFKKAAQLALSNGAEGIEEVQRLLDISVQAYSWAGMDPATVGVKAVEKSILVREKQQEGARICSGVDVLIAAGASLEALTLLDEAMSCYRIGESYKDIADCQAISFALEAEQKLKRTFPTPLRQASTMPALKALQEARPVLDVAASLHSVLLNQAADLMGQKLRHLDVLSSICRLWLLVIDDGLEQQEADDGAEAVPLPEQVRRLVEEVRSLEQAKEGMSTSCLLDLPAGLSSADLTRVWENLFQAVACAPPAGDALIDWDEEEEKEIAGGGAEEDARGGTLLVTVKHARGVPNADYGSSKSDPFVVLSVGRGRPQMTSVKKDTLDPDWNEEIEIPLVGKARGSELRVRLYDKDGATAELLSRLRVNFEKSEGGVFTMLDQHGQKRVPTTISLEWRVCE